MGKDVDTQGVEVVSDLATDLANEGGKCYSIGEAAKKVKRSQTWVKTHKAIVLEAFAEDSLKVVNSNGSLTEFGLKQLEEIKPFAAQGSPENYKIAVWAKYPKLAPSKKPNRVSDLANDLASDQAAVYPAGAIVVQETEELELDYGSEYGEAAALVRKEAQAAIQQGFQGAFQSVSFLRTAVKEIVRQEVSAGFFEGISAGIADGQNVVQTQVSTTPDAPKITRNRN
jgi:hypothetical protein